MKVLKLFRGFFVLFILNHLLNAVSKFYGSGLSENFFGTESMERRSSLMSSDVLFISDQSMDL